MKKAKLKRLLAQEASKNRKRRRKKQKPAANANQSLTVVPGKKRGASKVLEFTLARARAMKNNRPKLAEKVADGTTMAFQPYVPPPGVLPAGEKPMAMDSTSSTAAAIAWASNTIGAYWQEGLTFLGYAYLSELTLRPEYRVISQVIATEMTRKWITFEAATAEDKGEDTEGLDLEEQDKAPDGETDGEKDDAEGEKESLGEKFAGDADPADALIQMQQAKQDKADAKEEANAGLREERLAKMQPGDDKTQRIKELNEEMDRLQVRDVFYKIAEMDGWMGRCHLYADTGATDNPDELKMPLTNADDEYVPEKIAKGSLKRLALVEPLWCYPQQYNSTDPLRPDWYNPSIWFVMGKQLHASRLLTFVGRPVPDILKPAYAFGGLSLSQIAKPYIDNWLQTRQSVNDIIRAFSVMVLSTDLGSVLEASDETSMPGEGSGLFNRIDLFNVLRDNRGTFVLDKESEEFSNVSAPISGLDALQAQAQEHMASVSRIPLVKLLGISPQGLNASSEGELKTFYDTIAAQQEFFFRPQLTKVIHMAMLNLWGEIDEDITFKFNELWALNDKELAEVEKVRAETDDILVNGVAALHPEEARKRIAGDPGSPYKGLDVSDVPDPPDNDAALNLKGSMPFGKGAQGEEQQNPDDPSGEGGSQPENPFFQGGKDELPGVVKDRRGIVGDRDWSSESRRPGAGSSRGKNPNHINGDSSQTDWTSSRPARRSSSVPGELGENANDINDRSLPGERPALQGEPGGPIGYGAGAQLSCDAWNEGDHPRVTGGEHGGEFTSGGGGSGSGGGKTQPKATAAGQYAGMYETKGATPKENHALTVSKVLAKPAQKGIHYRRLLAHLIKEAPTFNGNSAVDPLKTKLGEALQMTYETLAAKGGKGAEIDKVLKTMQKLGVKPQPATKTWGGEAPKAAAPTPKPAASPSGVTAAELEQAKKTSAYYPAPASPEGKKLAEEFNNKYQNKPLTSTGALAEKVQAYKNTKASIDVAEQKHQAKLNEQAKAAAAEKAKAQAEKAKQAAAANAEYMKELGINEQEAYGFSALAKMMGGDTHAVVDAFKHYEEKTKKLGYPMTGFQGALISNYSNGGYNEINPALRSGSWTEAQHVYVKLVNKALRQMPAYEGKCYRGANLSSEVQSKFVVGNITPEYAFTSTSATPGGGFGGNTNFVITAIGKRGASIKQLSQHASENEVLFAARTCFKVTKVEGKPGSKMTVHMEEMDDD